MRVGLSCLYVELDKLGGLEARIKAVASALLDRGDTLMILQTRRAADGSKDFLSSSKDVTSIVVGDTAPKSFMHEHLANWLLDVPRLLQGRVDLLDTWDPYLKMTGRDFALVHSSYYYLEYFFRHLNKHSLGGLRYPLIDSGFLRPAMLYQADAVITENDVQRDYLRAFAPGIYRKCHVIPPGLPRSNDIIENVPVPDVDPNRLVFIGRVERLKGVDELLMAFRVVSESMPDLRLALIGGGPEVPDYVNLAERLGLSGKVTFTGPLPHKEAMEWLASSAALVLPSHLEGFPNTVLESMRMGVPVVVSDVGSVSRHLVTDGETGLLFQPWDAQGLAKAILHLMSEPSLGKMLSSQAREVAGEFTLERMVEGTLRTYKGALDRFHHNRT